MPNALTATGLTTATQSELLATFTTGFQQIYGTDINLASDSPDGQLMNIFIQTVLDVLDLLTQIYSSMDPDNAIGVTLDQRVAINGIQRQEGTFTVTPITIVTSASVNIYGLDQTANQVYTISDNAGNQWQLQTTVTGVPVGTNVYNFQAALPGATITTPNTINIQVTVVLGVTSVNNPTTYTTLGVNQEIDIALKIRRSKSVSLGSQGYLSGLYAALANIPGVSSAFIYENNSDTTDMDGVPSHSIWVIVAGSGAVSSIANAIYIKRNAGCGMFGEQTFSVTQVDGTLFPINWDDVVVVNLFTFFTATSLNGTTAPAVSNILASLPLSFIPGVNQEVNINGLSTLVQQIDSNTLVTNSGFSNGQVQVLTLSAVAASGTFEINYNGNNSAAINWNDDLTTIQNAARAITGLSSVVVTGSISSKTLTFTLTTIPDVLALIYVTNNSLMTSVPAAITFSYNEGFTNTLTPTSKKYQFIISAPNIVIIPIQMSPSSAVVAPDGTVTFSSAGGYGVYAYSILINNSGGNMVGNVYTAGSPMSIPSIDTVQVVDSFGNVQTALVTVT